MSELKTAPSLRHPDTSLTLRFGHVTSLTGVVLLLHAPLVVLLPAPTCLAVMTHLLQQVEHSDLTPTSLIVRLTVNDVVQRGRRPSPSLFTTAGVTWSTGHKQHVTWSAGEVNMLPVTDKN